MKNPWISIPLSDYEAHMSLENVAQLQALDRLMSWQLGDSPARTAFATRKRPCCFSTASFFIDFDFRRLSPALAGPS